MTAVVDARTIREAQLAELSDYAHVLHRVDFSKVDYDGTPDCEPVDDLDDANGISSEIAEGVLAGWHTVAIDLDVHAQLVPSTTPGHSHLYIDKAMTWANYLKLLHVLAEVGVLEPGYVGASERRGHTTLRLPWIAKETPASE